MEVKSKYIVSFRLHEEIWIILWTMKCLLTVKMFMSALTEIRLHKAASQDVRDYFPRAPASHMVMLARPLVVTNVYIFTE